MPSGSERLPTQPGTAPPPAGAIIMAPGRAADPAARSAEVVRDLAARRFLLASAAAFLLIFGLVWAYTAALPMAYLTRDYPAWVAKRGMLNACQLGAVSFFGDSRAMAAIEPRALPFSSSNFAFSGSSPIEAYFALRRALRCKNQPRAVVIAYSSGKYMSDDDYFDISTRIGLLSFADMRHVQAMSRRLKDPEIDKLGAGSHLSPWALEALYALHFPSLYFSSLVNGYVFGRYFYNMHAEHVIRHDRGQAFFGLAAGSDAVAAEATMPRFAASPLIDAYFTSMISALAKRDIPVVLISLPINDATCRTMNPALRSGFSRYLRHIVATMPDARVVGPILPCWPDALFGDAFHLNPSGAARYTQMVGHALLRVLVKPGDSAQIVER